MRWSSLEKESGNNHYVGNVFRDIWFDLLDFYLICREFFFFFSNHSLRMEDIFYVYEQKVIHRRIEVKWQLTKINLGVKRTNRLESILAYIMGDFYDRQMRNRLNSNS